MIKNVNIYLKTFMYKTILIIYKILITQITNNFNKSIKIQLSKMLISKLSVIIICLILMSRSKFVYTSMQTFKTYRWVILSF